MPTARLLHWITTMLVVAVLPLAWVMVNMTWSVPLEERFANCKVSARISHRLLYPVTIATPISTLLFSAFREQGTTCFDLFVVPETAANKRLAGVADGSRRDRAVAGYKLISSHPGVTAWDVVLRRGRVLKRMLPVWET